MRKKKNIYIYSLLVISFSEKLLSLAKIICIFLLSDFKANVDNKPRAPICFENELPCNTGYNEKLAFELLQKYIM